MPYLYREDYECDDCMKLRARNKVVNNQITPHDEGVEHLLDLWAVLDGIDRSDESTYSVMEFPQVAEQGTMPELHCGRCSAPLFIS